MDDITGKSFLTTSNETFQVPEETPSLLTVIIETDPIRWRRVIKRDSCKDPLRKVIKALIVHLNAHISLNNSNKVAVIAAHEGKAKFLYPDFGDFSDSGSNGSNGIAKNGHSSSHQYLKNSNIYRQFKIVDESVLKNFDKLINEDISAKNSGSSENNGTADNNNNKNQGHKNVIPGSISLALTYINKLKMLDDSLSIKARIIIMGISDDSSLQYIPLMNCIFAAQKMRIPIDVCKFSSKSTFLQQASDTTNGIYSFINDNEIDGIIQYLSTTFFIDPSLRKYIILPTDVNIDFRASCFLTGEVVDIGYVCSVCLCILSRIPENNICPTCDSKFDLKILSKLRRKPAFDLNQFRKKKKLNPSNNGNGGDTNGTPTPVSTPLPSTPGN
ncbi:TFIIH/NER complex subunit TFB4 [Ascoidea rubescens DSM 1968]|uniref:General transcription and DNA repair factor IIH subunit TFB4 n=1 Tax=Ascoidea rubescens DSM 1968 TaxID=1344418 RepID=A0A1D2VQF8_9ASCO|nr:Tfb4-domain-containing protein [Ascoidea rubescens DSM 1968]ODV63844.1 Tfb4-domain-containing protein [Ascoidea rubescens DSM 1968]